ncbi:MAG: TolC family protein [candidate division Zixibacteria bacterium]|nr:TolC family protein [candidate division Zixibacteria bacterium]
MNKFFAFKVLLQVLCLICLLPSVPVLGQLPNNQLSLREAVDKAFSVDNNLMAAGSNLKSSKYNIKKAKASYMPALTFAGSYYHMSNVSEISVGMPGTGFNETIKMGSDTPFNANLGLNYELYTFGRRPANVQLAKLETNRSELNYSFSKKILFDKTARAYFTVVYAKGSMNLIQAEKDRFEQIYQLVDSRFKQDLISEFDLLQTQLRLEKYKLSLLEISNNLQTAKLNLARLLGVPKSDLPELADDIGENILELPKFVVRANLLANREDYLEASLAIKMGQAAKKISKSAYYPSITGFGAYDWRNGYQPDVENIEGNFSFGVKLNWLLFHGFARRAEISKQDYLIKSYGYMVEDLKTVIPNQINSLQLIVENSKSRIEVGAQALQVAQKSMAIARMRLEIGDITMIDLLEIENNLSQAELNLIKLNYGYVMAKLDYKKACGYYPEIEQY